MAIKNRRGPYNKFDPTKLLPGEWAVVLSGDPHASDGLACYMCLHRARSNVWQPMRIWWTTLQHPRVKWWQLR